MFDRLEKPFLTVETGEAYQPVRLTYTSNQTDNLINNLEKLKCIEKAVSPNTWHWYWKEECEDQHFESIDSFRKNPKIAVKLGTLTIRDDKVYISLNSFKRACLAVVFFYKNFPDLDILKVVSADFINKVYAIDERLPHGFTELFKDDELDSIINQRLEEYMKVKGQCEQAKTPEEAFEILSNYTRSEAKKRLPYAERYAFELTGEEEADVVCLAFYIFLRGRELVAIKRWFGQTGYSLADATDETIEQVFGGGINVE